MKNTEYLTNFVGYFLLKHLLNWSLEDLARVYPHQVPWNTRTDTHNRTFSFWRASLFSVHLSWQQQALLLPKRGNGNNKSHKRHTVEDIWLLGPLSDLLKPISYIEDVTKCYIQ